LDVVIDRLFSVYGPPQRKLLLWDLGQRLLSGQREIMLDGTGEETRDFIHVADAAAVVTRLALTPAPPSTVNVGTGLSTAIKTLAASFASQLGVNAEIRFTGRSRPGDPVHQQANISRLDPIGCRSSMTLDAGLADYGSWLRKLLSRDSATLAPH
jgi:UDP-glucose 4-epimerase